MERNVFCYWHGDRFVEQHLTMKQLAKEFGFIYKYEKQPYGDYRKATSA